MSSPQRPSTFSQNFFHSAALVDALLDKSSIQRGDLVLDLGAGTGLISERLVRRGCRVLAVEDEPALGACLAERISDVAIARVIRVAAPDTQLPRQPYKGFFNIPIDFAATDICDPNGAAS